MERDHVAGTIAFFRKQSFVKTPFFLISLSKFFQKTRRKKMGNQLILPRVVTQIFVNLDSTDRGRRLRFSKVCVKAFDEH